MSHALIKSTKLSIFHFKNLQFHSNGRHFYCSAATSFSGLGSQIRGREGPHPPRKLSNSCSLSLYALLHSTHHHTLSIPHFQVPFILPHSTPLHLQEFLPMNSCTNYRTPFIPKSLKFVTLGSNQCNRGYCSVVNDDDDDDDDESRDRADGDKGGKGMPDLEEVDRVCRLIDELFALDHSMEAALDGCGVDLTHDLVLAVLNRFKHARRPAFRFFCWAGNRNGFAHDSRTYNKMMRILGKTRQFETMISFIEDMGEKGLLTLKTFQISIKAFAAAKETKKAVGLFELMKKYEFKVGVETINMLLDELGKARRPREANYLFSKLEPRFTPNIRTYTSLLYAWCSVKNLLEAGKIWNLMIDKGFKPDIVAHNIMLNGFLKCKRSADSIKLFEVMKAKGPSPNVRSYTMIIMAMIKLWKMEEALSYFQEMLDSGCEPDAAIYTCLITGFGNQKKMDKVYSLLVEMKKKGFSPDSQLYNALIRLMTRRQMLVEIVQVYKKMIRDGLHPSIHTFNMMMRSFFIAKDYEMASALWGEMKRRGCCPDENTYTVLIGGLVGLGRSVEAYKFLEEMIEKGMKPPQLDYKRFTADFSQIGKPGILEELAQRTKFSGKVEVSDVFARWAAKIKIRNRLKKYG